jgi:hypothetical protein
MSEDVSAQVAGLISGSKVFGGSDNIRHGKYVLMIKRIFADLVDTDKGKHKMAFVEMEPIKSEHNPQVEGDRVDYVSPTAPGSGPLKDDGTKPNGVGTACALKVDFDGAGGRSAGSNIKAFILALFGKREGEIPDEEVNKTWLDLSLTRDLKAGECYPGTNIPAPTAKRANPACGMIIGCTTMTKRKKTPNEKGAHITKLLWQPAAPFGQGENAPDKVAARRLEIESKMTAPDEEEDTTATPAAPGVNPYAQAQQVVAPVAAPVVTPTLPPPAPPPPVVVAPQPFVPVAPWEPHPTHPGFFWSNPAKGGSNAVKNEQQLRSGQ